jgi:chlorite dismutase
MRVAKKYSHLNGEEWLLVHEEDTYQEIIDVIRAIDAERCRTKISKEKQMKGKSLTGEAILPSHWLSSGLSLNSL